MNDQIGVCVWGGGLRDTCTKHKQQIKCLFIRNHNEADDAERLQSGCKVETLVLMTTVFVVRCTEETLNRP